MPDTHLWMVVVPFAVNMWWTKTWLVTRPASLWRHVIAAMSGGILWVYIAFAATRYVEAGGDGSKLVYNTQAVTYFAAFMAFVSVIGLLLGLFLWTEEEAEEATEELRETVDATR